MRKLRLLLLGCVIVLIVLSFQFPTILGSTESSSFSSETIPEIPEEAEPVIDIQILDAYYTCLENDLIENDIVTHFRCVIPNLPGRENGEIIEIYILLEIPDGSAVIVHGFIISMPPGFYLNVFYYDLANVGGNYTVSITAISIFVFGWDFESLIFDPPGSSPGDPDFSE
ncbi:MAG: hypothetical protein ACFFC7_25910 [Candidatus Hermodarchaeota archaeon]